MRDWMKQNGDLLIGLKPPKVDLSKTEFQISHRRTFEDILADQAEREEALRRRDKRAQEAARQAIQQAALNRQSAEATGMREHTPNY